MENPVIENSGLLEQKALNVLHEYEGANNYILKLKGIFNPKKRGVPTRSQCEYIMNYSQTTPKVAKKWVELDDYFSEKISNEKLYTVPPKQVWVEKLLVEKDKSYHIWGRFFESEPMTDFWLPRVAIIKNPEQYYKEIDYSKYEHRPLLTHQVDAVEKLVKTKRFILADDMGLGKGLSNNSLIYTPLGPKKMGNIIVGDKVFGSDGKSYNVIGVFPQGKKETYKVLFNDGYSILTDDEHLWSVSSPNYGKNRQNERQKKSLVLSTKQMYDGGKIKIKGFGHNKEKEYDIETYYKSPNGNNKWQIPIVKPVQFVDNNELPIEPYLLGLSLGDGHFDKTGRCRFVVHRDDYEELFGKLHLKPIKCNKNCLGGSILLKEQLEVLKLSHTRSHNKFIPDIYKYTSIENRLSILQGLMDTDGHCMISKNGSFNGTEYTTISEKLCDDVCEIVQTLGGIARKKSRRSFYKKDGKKVECSISYRVNIKLPSGMNPFRLKRKSDRYIEPKKYPTGRYIKNIEKVGEDYCTCISVDSPDKLYVTEHCIVTHNTTSTIVAALETEAKRILIICPASLKINWQREIENYTDRSTYICSSKRYEDADFVIVNYDILKNFHDPKDRDNSRILKSNFDLVVLDECFTYDTKIMTELGEINIGDIVENGIDVKILTFNHKEQKLEYQKINRWIRKRKDSVYKIKFSNGRFIECTDNHKFYVNEKGYVRAKDLTPTDNLYMLPETFDKKTNLEKGEGIKFVRVDSIEILERGSYDKSTKVSSKDTRVYDLEISSNHNYFANSILVSNCHYVQNSQAQRTKLINDFVKGVDRLWLLTGTPITSRPINYFNLLNLVDSPVAQNWMAYVIRYCEGYQFKAGNRKVWNVMGASNLEELRDRTSRQVLRRLKTDVLDLPDKIITPVYLRLKSKEYEELMGEYFEWYEKNPDESSSLTVQFTKLTKVRKVIAQEKINSTIELVENILEQDKKVIVFTNFTDSLNKIYEHFGKQAVYLDGSCSPAKRQHAVDEFQNNEKIKVFVGNMKAASVGITLTAAEAVIMNDLSFVPSDHSQAEDRSYRYGQKSNVSVYYPIFENTIEGVIYDILNKKKNIFETVMGDNVGRAEIVQEIMNQIVSRR